MNYSNLDQLQEIYQQNNQKQLALFKILAESRQNLGFLKWQQEITNKYHFNVTKQVIWTVLNSFHDVQSSPDGDTYASQKITNEDGDVKYFLYKWLEHNQTWSITDKNFQAKAIRFDRLGKFYYLSPDNCVYSSDKQILVCGLSDFEVTSDQKIIGIKDPNGSLESDTVDSLFRTDEVSGYKYKALVDVKTIALNQDELVTLDLNGKVNEEYNGICMKDITAGVDASMWGLLCEDNVTDYEIVKWQILIDKWYMVPGARAVSLSAYNEVSVAILDSQGMIRLSSMIQNDNQTVSYITINSEIGQISNQIHLKHGKSYVGSSTH
ncbi:UNKNOWN [Stylonychia lemnae]|uniref:Uncharacterized protein n=1 Tax=Stylonychia lemnae TaxID=5949 RepID=A0A078ASA0_STYLE|nr:UNKNOWN [Stylonychia lemnae]|eukprot:CDW84092.1 UNKNOWN [Stylonychia lemnae]